MRIALIIATLLAVSVRADDGTGAFAIVQGPDGTVKAPLFSDQYASLPVARVDKSAVTLGELSFAIGASHSARGAAGDSKKPAKGKKDYSAVLDRLIGVRLICLEAHEMGLDELPEVKEELARLEQSGLREALKARLTRDVAADPAEVERIYKDSVREWKVRSLLFPAEADAKAALSELKAGKPWDDVVKASVATRKAKGGTETQAISEARRALVQVIEALKPVEAGGTAAPVRVEKGFALLHVDAIGFPENAAKRQEAEEASLKRRQALVLAKAYAELVKKHARINEKRLKSLDFEAKKPGFENLRKDRRVLATVEGEKDVTVADVAAAIDEQFFHGIQQAIASKKVNAQKIAGFNSILYGRIFDAEARREKISESPDYQRGIATQRDALLFGKFVEKVISPDVRITEGEAKAYYEQHKADYTYPAFYTLSSIAFEDARAAQAARDKLKAGTDFKWLKSNAPGQLAPEKREIEFEGTTVSARAMPADLAKALSGTSANDARTYAAREGGHYLLQVKAVTPPAMQPYAEARADIAPKLQRLKVGQSVDDWIAKLRKAREVKVLITQLGG